MSERIRRAEVRFIQGMAVLEDLRLVERWKKVGTPFIVGAMGYGLPVAPDIDMEIFCRRPSVEAGFRVLSECVTHPRVRKARFANELDGPDQGLYFQLRYLDGLGEEWKLDMWLVANDHPGPLSRDLLTPMRRALTEESRDAILEIKEAILARGLKYRSIDVYRAVLEGGVRGLEAFQAWHERVKPSGLTDWRPKLPR
ncbi:MAG: hypothetical protein ACOY93_21025 [Bacillota bacterium]